MMKDTETNQHEFHPFHPAKEEVANRPEHPKGLPQANSPSYRLAFTDADFLLREELRPVRLQLELLKPGLLMAEHGIESTIAMFGSARIKESQKAQADLDKIEQALAQNPDDKKLQQQYKRAKSTMKFSHFYDEARKLARLISEIGQKDARKKLVVVTGGGPGIMEAGNRGAADVNAESIGLNIVLPHEQTPNPYITPELTFLFHYFAIRKMHFMIRSKALVAFPGGFGTLDELFGILTLIQTKKIDPIPVILFGQAYWQKVIDFDELVEGGMIHEDDLHLFHFADKAENAVTIIKKFYNLG